MAEKRLAVVAGAAGGMGAATVARLAGDGFRIAAIDINRKGLKAAGGAAVTPFATDVTDETAVRRTIARIEKRLGPIHALVNLVGWCETHRFETEDSAYWRKIIAVNFESVIYLTHAVIPGMIRRKHGKIVYVTSDAGRVGQSGEAVYAGMKGGAIAFAKSLARELARYNITVNCTAPGPTDTPLERAQDPEVIQRIIRWIPFRRWARPEEQAAGIAFLCSPDSDYITGQTLSVSGGLTML